MGRDRVLGRVLRLISWVHFVGNSVLSGLSADHPGQPGDATQKALGLERSGIARLRVTRPEHEEASTFELPGAARGEAELRGAARSCAGLRGVPRGKTRERSSSPHPPGRGFGSAQPLPAGRGVSEQQHGSNASTDSHPAGPSCRSLLHPGRLLAVFPRHRKALSSPSGAVSFALCPPPYLAWCGPGRWSRGGGGAACSEHWRFLSRSLQACSSGVGGWERCWAGVS